MLSPFFGFNGLFNSFDNSIGPHVEVRESETHAFIEMEVPRYRAAEIKLESDPQSGLITVIGKRDTGSRGNEYDRLLFSSAPVSGFRRSFRFSPDYYDLSKAESSLEFGIFTLKVPKRDTKAIEAKMAVAAKESKPVTVFSGGNARSKDVVSKTTPEEFSAITHARWPPKIKQEEDAQSLTYKCELPPTVSKEHLSLTLRGRLLELCVDYKRHTKTDHGEETQTATFSTTLPVPQGTKPEDIHTVYESGTLTITLAKHTAPPAIDVKQQ